MSMYFQFVVGNLPVQRADLNYLWILSVQVVCTLNSQAVWGQLYIILIFKNGVRIDFIISPLRQWALFFFSSIFTVWKTSMVKQ